MEILPVVNKKDELVDESPREICHAKGLRHRAVHIFIFNKKGEILLQKRSADKDEYPSYYEASVSGHVLKNETYEEAAIRELEEETGLIFEPEKLDKKNKFEIKFGNEHHFVQLFVLFTSKKPELHDGEVEKFEWIQTKELVKQIKANKKKFTPEFLAAMENFILKK
ncbi:NUDIX domain-containing protein [Candidatus Woesearchaeota archaeon]|nr:NUDIX domain-containing protein [Candidatus Woesearchaeota archaeon]